MRTNPATSYSGPDAALRGQDEIKARNRLLRSRSLIPAAIIAMAIVGALLVVVLSPSAAAGPTQVYMESENGRLVATVSSLEVGQAKTTQGGGSSTEEIQWTALEPAADPVDTRDGPGLLGEGTVRGEGFTELRITFSSVQIVRNGSLHELEIPQDTLQVRLTEEGKAGDSLLVALDAERSISQEDGYLAFRPHVLDSLWEPDGAGKGAPPARTPTTSDRSSGDPVTPPRAAPGTVQSDSGSKGPAADRPPKVGWLHVAFIGNATGIVNELDARVSKVGLSNGHLPDEVTTVMDRDVDLELVREPEEGSAVVGAFQVKPGTYTSIHFEFTNASAQVGRFSEREAHVPQPWLVLEAPVNVSAGQVVGVVIELGVEDSLRAGLDGLEFRPVIRDYHVAGSDGRDLKEPLPAQYRTGGSWLPSLGDQVDKTLRDQDIDPDEVPHPVGGDEDRDPRSDGSIGDLDPGSLEELLTDSGGTVGGLLG